MLRPGDEPIPGYRLESFLGRGQFGQVWRATAPGGGSAALKFLDLGGKEGWKEFRGVQRVKEIRHAHLMPVTAFWLLDDAGRILDEDSIRHLAPTDDGMRDTLMPGQAEATCSPRWLVIAQLLADGTLLDELQKYKDQGTEGIPLETLLVYMEEAAKGIDFLNSARHDLGGGLHAVQHCDIKPANMLLVGGSVLICDFGLAQLLSAKDQQAKATGVLGSPAYMAPECLDQAPSATSDQYSLAISYYELRTGELPFKAQTAVAALTAHRTGDLDRSKLPERERAVIARATSLRPEDRFPNCLAMVRALQQATGVTPAPAPTRPWRLQLAGLVVTLAVAAVLAAFALALARRSTEPPPTQVTIQVEPDDAELLIDGESHELVAGRVVVKRAAGSNLKLVASKGADFEVEVRQVDLREHDPAEPIQIALQPSALFLVKKSWQKLQENQFEAAVEAYAQALEKDADYNRFPPPLVLMSGNQSTPTSEIRAMDISRDGRWLVTAGTDGVVRGWNAQGKLDGAESTVLHRHDGPVEALAVGRDWVISADGQGILIASSLSTPSARNLSRSLETLGIVRLGITRDDRFALTGTDGELRRWELSQTGISSEGLRIGHHDELIDVIRVAPDGRSVITGSWDGTAKQWPLDGPVESGIELGRISEDVYTVAVTEQFVALAGAEQDTEHHVYLAPLGGGELQPLEEGHASPIICLRFDESGNWLAAGSEDSGRLTVWHRAASGPWEHVPLPTHHNDSVTALEFGPSGAFLVSTSNDGQVILWDLETTNHRVAVLHQQTAPVVRVCLGVDGKWLFTAGVNGQVHAWDFRRCQVIKKACDRANVAPRPAPAADSGVET
jgi:WD40 repeat protein/serine/threonine protein kinase